MSRIMMIEAKIHNAVMPQMVWAMGVPPNAMKKTATIEQMRKFMKNVNLLSGSIGGE